MPKVCLEFVLNLEFVQDAGVHIPEFYAREWEQRPPSGTPELAAKAWRSRDFLPITRDVFDRLARDDVRHPERYEPYRGNPQQSVSVVIEVPDDPLAPMQVLDIEASVVPRDVIVTPT